MRLLLVSVLLCAAGAMAQISASLVCDHEALENGTVCITATAVYSAAYSDCVEVALDPSPDIGEVNPDISPTIRIGCPSSVTSDLYEMSIVIEGVAGDSSSCRVTAAICLDIGQCIRPDAEIRYGITWFGYAKNPPPNGYPLVCLDAGYVGTFRYR